MNISCNVMDDLLPLYAEDMVSADTAALVRDHLCGCSVCREKMKAFPEKEEEMHRSIEKLTNLQKKIRSRRITAAMFAFLLSATMLLSAVAFLISPVYLTVEEAGVQAFVGEETSFIYHVTEEGELHSPSAVDSDREADERPIVTLYFSDIVRHVSESRSKDPDTGEETVTVSAYCWRLDTLFPRESDSVFGYGREADFDRLYYASYDGREDTLLWGSRPDGGVQTMPRLVLGYYVVISILMGTALLAGAAALRKRPEGKTVFALGCWFDGLAVSMITVSGGRWPTADSGDVQWMLTFAVVLATLITATILCGGKVRKQHKEDL